MRITGGELGGRRFEAHASPHLRPALDQIRESIFNILRERVSEARVLDAFAGTGSLGLESLSRGARHVIFVEQHRPTAQRVERLLVEWKLAERAEVCVAQASPRAGSPVVPPAASPARNTPPEPLPPAAPGLEQPRPEPLKLEVK